MVLEIAAADLKWFEEMRESDWEFCAEEHSLATTPHLDRDCHCNQYSQVTSMESVTSSLCRDASTADTTEDDLRQLENALQPLKEDLINSSITYAKHMESLARRGSGCLQASFRGMLRSGGRRRTRPGRRRTRRTRGALVEPRAGGSCGSWSAWRLSCAMSWSTSTNGSGWSAPRPTPPPPPARR
jgi:hypothetical protein